MILWCDAAADPAAQMHRDATLLERVAAGALREGVLRLFQFAPAGITLGRAQDPARELDLDALRADGVPWAIRPTGGRAIFHAEEWTFSLAAPLGSAGWATSPAAAYLRTCTLFARALTALGVPVQLAGHAHGDAAPRARQGAAPPCFASTARAELLLDGRKCAGIAQRQVGGALLQQGSLLLGDGHLRLVDYLRAPAGGRDAARAALAAASAAAGRYVGTHAPLGLLGRAVGAALEPRERLNGKAGAERLGLPA